MKNEILLMELKQMHKAQDEMSKILLDLTKESSGTAERTMNIWRLTEKQEDHLTKLNGRTSENTTAIAIVNEKTKTSKKAIAGYSGGGLLLLALTVLQIIQRLA